MGFHSFGPDQSTRLCIFVISTLERSLISRVNADNEVITQLNFIGDHT